MFGYLIDMDGVIYRGNELIAGAERFIRELRSQQAPFLFLTNNSQRTRRDVATKLQRLGIDAEEEHVYTCAMATARFLAWQKPNGTAFVIGEGGLLTALHNNGYSIVEKDPDYVVVGEGRTLNFEMVEAAVGMILQRRQAGGNESRSELPHSNRHATGLWCGGLDARNGDGSPAFSVGKPSPVMLRGARKELGLSTEETIVIGDTMETDVLGGVQLGCKTILVLSGNMSADQLPNYAFRPDKIVDSLANLSHAQLIREFAPPRRALRSRIPAGEPTRRAPQRLGQSGRHVKIDDRKMTDRKIDTQYSPDHHFPVE